MDSFESTRQRLKQLEQDRKVEREKDNQALLEEMQRRAPSETQLTQFIMSPERPMMPAPQELQDGDGSILDQTKLVLARLQDMFQKRQYVQFAIGAVSAYVLQDAWFDSFSFDVLHYAGQIAAIGSAGKPVWSVDLEPRRTMTDPSAKFCFCPIQP